MITLEKCKKFAESKGYELSSFAEKIVSRAIANNGFCPCVSEEERKQHPENNYQCPCSLLEKDIKEMGHCHCMLYIKK